MDRLTALLPELPTVVVHGGARRGSLLFDGEQVAGVLDFDSAHADVRVLDLAVSVHDVGKVYTHLGQEDHKVALDLGRVTEVLDAYRGQVRTTPAEAEALPLFLEAKRLHRALGRRNRAGPGNGCRTTTTRRSSSRTRGCSGWTGTGRSWRPPADRS